MLPKGLCSAWFRSDEAKGMGVIDFKVGRASGGDTVLGLFGSDEQDDDQITALYKTERYSRGNEALFGQDELDIQITGHHRIALALASSA